MFYDPSVFVRNIQLAQANQCVISPMNPVDDKKGSLSCPMIAAMCKPIFSFKVWHEMTVKDTAIWIWTLGYTYGWPEAEFYSRSFQKNGIAGDMLPELSLHRLEDDLGIRNAVHSMEIMCAIDLLFPNAKANQFRALAGSQLAQNRHGGIVSMDEQASPRSLMSTSAASVEAMSESFISTSESSLRDSKITNTIHGEKVDSKSRSLILTLCPEQKVPVGEIELLKSRFAKFNYTVEIIPYTKKDNSYVVVFNDVEAVRKARAESASIGYNFTKYRDQRPSPDNPVRFKTLYKLQVRAGKSLKGRKIKMLDKNAIVTANQVKGRRARIISFRDGEPVGWVSLISEEGTQLLERLEKAPY